MNVYAFSRMLRGGGWNYVARYARCAFRDKFGAEYRSSSLGVRFVMMLR